MSKVPNEPKIDLTDYEWKIQIRQLRMDDYDDLVAMQQSLLSRHAAVGPGSDRKPARALSRRSTCASRSKANSPHPPAV